MVSELRGGNGCNQWLVSCTNERQQYLRLVSLAAIASGDLRKVSNRSALVAARRWQLNMVERGAQATSSSTARAHGHSRQLTVRLRQSREIVNKRHASSVKRQGQGVDKGRRNERRNENETVRARALAITRMMYDGLIS